MIAKAASYQEQSWGPEGKAAVALIDRRTLFRECLALGLQERLSFPIRTYADFSSWSRDRSAPSTSAIILNEQNVSAADGASYELKELLACSKAAPVIILSETPSAKRVADALRCGARGLIPTETPLDVAAEAIQLVVAGGYFIPANVVDLNEPQSASRAEDALASRDFTPRENQVVEALLSGKPNKLIAYDTGLAESSVKYHIRSVLRKLKARNRTEAVTKLSEIIRRSFAR